MATQFENELDLAAVEFPDFRPSPFPCFTAEELERIYDAQALDAIDFANDVSTTKCPCCHRPIGDHA